MRTYVYVDGFNLYYGAVKNTPYKWLDLKAAFSQLLQAHHQILAIKYFTAKVHGHFDPNQPLRQQTYIRALEAFIPEMHVTYGHFLTNSAPARLAAPPHDSVTVIKTEEKGSDVNLAIHLLNDAWHDRYDCAVVVSNDSDLAEALRLVRVERSKVVGVVTPARYRTTATLAKNAKFIRHIRPALMARTQLPDPIPGTNLRKPRGW